LALIIKLMPSCIRVNNVLVKFIIYMMPLARGATINFQRGSSDKVSRHKSDKFYCFFFSKFDCYYWLELEFTNIISW